MYARTRYNKPGIALIGLLSIRHPALSLPLATVKTAAKDTPEVQGCECLRFYQIRQQPLHSLWNSLARHQRRQWSFRA